MNSIILSTSPLPVITSINISIKNIMRTLHASKIIRILKVALQENFVYALFTAPID